MASKTFTIVFGGEEAALDSVDYFMRYPRFSEVIPQLLTEMIQTGQLIVQTVREAIPDASSQSEESFTWISKVEFINFFEPNKSNVAARAFMTLVREIYIEQINTVRVEQSGSNVHMEYIVCLEDLQAYFAEPLHEGVLLGIHQFSPKLYQLWADFLSSR